MLFSITAIELLRGGTAVLARNLILLTILLSLSACQHQNPSVESSQLRVVTVIEGSVRRDGTIILREPTDRNSPLTGEWVEKDGSRFCNGYMTRAEGEAFCVSEIPEDWVPFEFEGQTYFVQPLADGTEY